MIRSAVIGAGQISRQHLACLSTLPDVQLVGVCDLSQALAESAADRYKVSGWYTDHTRLLAEAKPDIVHITTPVSSHFRLAQDCLNAGAHVLVEKPATARLEEITALQELARSKNKLFIEDYNYLYNAPIRQLREWIDAGKLGETVHVDVTLCLDMLGKDNPFTDPNLRHPALDAPGGVIGDFLPHLASLAYFFSGPVRSARSVWSKRSASSPLPHDEFRAVFEGARATGSLAFSAHAQPDLFRFTVFGTKGRATADIYENRLSASTLRSGPKPLIPFFNAREEAKVLRRSAWKLLWQKIGSGPGAYDGLWELIRRVYDGLSSGKAPYSPQDMLEVNRLVEELRKEGNRL